MSLPSYWDAVQLPKTVYVEGVVPSLADGDVALRMRANQSCRDVVNLTVVCPMTVTWEADPSNAELENDPINGGKRIFPDKLSPGDLTPTIRQQVKLVATVSPRVPGVTVYFKVFDVDDPFDQLNPSMADVSLIDNNTSGPDNRGTEAFALPWTTSALTGADGKARVTFTVSMQPGNNYRAGACTLQAAVTGATQTRADAADDRYTGPKPGNFEGFSAPLNWSEMLTVWRKLYLDLDSMGPGTDSSTLINRNLDGTGSEPAHGSHSWAEINGWNEMTQEGRLEGGTLTVVGGGVYEIVDSVYDIGDDSVYVQGSIPVDEDKLATATDDDAAFAPRKVDWSAMSEKYAPAYVQVFELVGSSQLVLPFVANVGLDDVSANAAASPGQTPTSNTSPDFWVAQVVACSQGRFDQDHDPDSVYHFWAGDDFKQAASVGEVGALYGQTMPSTSSLYDNVSLIHVETIRDRAAWTQVFGIPPFMLTPVLNATALEQVNVVHEVAHQFGLGHTTTGCMIVGTEDRACKFTGLDLSGIRGSSAIGQP